MTSNTPENSDAHSSLSERQRAAAFAQANAPVGADGLARVGRPPIPAKFVVTVAIVFVVLGLGGVVIEHFFGGIGTTRATSTIATLPPSTNRAGPALDGPTRAFMGMKEIATATAAPFVLLDQSGRPWSLAAQRGKVVVLTFFNAACNDVCPVEGAEIRRARTALGATADRVEFAVVNSDPKHLTPSRSPAALTVPGLERATTVHFLTGSLHQLNAIWIAYGVRVRVGALANQVAHNDVMYFISPDGRLRSLVVPFARVDDAGRFHLSPSEVGRFAQGVAAEAISLAG